ncbi:NUDIX domain-containing protein [Aquisalimonas lutea]|uniref:NUDIX hydrolase n=1 Tax=Aquisalimonas lutea TaxID=1327750 RepID=UPI0025B54D26|nr:NUDIX domain-containing protein [Aquisalimonas lutea]MDN3517945.1 NUDIX domain-containing protein [Aquisalimonas lutea]
MPAEPHPAATIILLRDGRPAPEVLLLKRTATTRFGPGAYVFPGGAVDAQDAGDGQAPCALGDTVASNELGVRSGGLAYRQAAIRECFEEAGVLLACSRHGVPLDMREPDLARRFADHRYALRRQQLTFAALCHREDLRLYGPSLHYVSHWITPPHSPRRFDTRFFLAVAPPGQDATCCGEETVAHAWLTPTAALAAQRAGDMELMTPTRHTLERLRHYGSVPALLEAIAGAGGPSGEQLPGHGLVEQRIPAPA